MLGSFFGWPFDFLILSYEPLDSDPLDSRRPMARRTHPGKGATPQKALLDGSAGDAAKAVPRRLGFKTLAVMEGGPHPSNGGPQGELALREVTIEVPSGCGQGGKTPPSLFEPFQRGSTVKSKPR